MFAPHKFLLWNIILDLAFFFALSVVTLVIHLVVEPTHRGFFTDDQSIIYPYKDSTVSNTLLSVCSVIIPLVTILATEYLRTINWTSGKTRVFFQWDLPCFIWTTYVVYGVFLFGLTTQILVVDVGKTTIGRLRPHFWEICQPVYNETSVQRLNYITDYSCAGTDSYLVSEVRKSFPSGHTSTATYASVFLVLYLGLRAKWSGSDLLLPFCQVALISLGWFVGLSRVMDHKHHWSDVTVGYVIGFAIACVAFYYVYKSPGFRKVRPPRWRSEDSELVWGPNNTPVIVPKTQLVTNHTSAIMNAEEHTSITYNREVRPAVLNTVQWNSPNDYSSTEALTARQNRL